MNALSVRMVQKLNITNLMKRMDLGMQMYAVSLRIWKSRCVLYVIPIILQETLYLEDILVNILDICRDRNIVVVADECFLRFNPQV